MDAFDDDPFAGPTPPPPPAESGEPGRPSLHGRGPGFGAVPSAMPIGYRAYDEPTSRGRNHLTFALAVLCGIRAGIALIGLILSMKLDVEGGMWEIDGFGTLVAVSGLMLIASFAYAGERPGAPAMSLCADAIQLIVTVNAFMDARPFEGKPLVFVQIIIMPVTSVVLAVKVLQSRQRQVPRPRPARDW